MTWREQYFQRVRPIVGAGFFSKRVVVYRLRHAAVVAEALCRTGLTRQVWFGADDAPDVAFARSFGAGDDGSQAASSVGRALEQVCRRHNHFESEWHLEHQKADVAELAACLARQSVDLVLAPLDTDAPAVARATIDAGCPLILTLAPRAAYAESVHLVWTPDSGVAPDDLLDAATRLADVPAAEPGHHFGAHVQCLETQSLTLGLARWLLTRSTASRPDLEKPLVTDGLALMRRGTPEWPWHVDFFDPAGAQAKRWCTSLHRPAPRYFPPISLAKRERLLVLGLGTASLFVLESPALFEQVFMIDCKEVSVFNPVRQAYSTAHIGQPKPDALADILRTRLGGPATWTEGHDGFFRTHTLGKHLLGSASLTISERNPRDLDRFGALLDRLRPDLAIVGMGRTRDDNFAATHELRKRGIRHITPSAFAAVTHFKHILTDGEQGPCYDCIQGHLLIDSGSGSPLTTEQREMFYGGTQPATLCETYPSAHSLLRLAHDLTLHPKARPAYLMRELNGGRTCFVGANRAERSEQGEWLFGVDRPFAMVTFGEEDVLAAHHGLTQCSCGRTLGVSSARNRDRSQQDKKDR